MAGWSMFWAANARTRPLDQVEPPPLAGVLAAWRAAAGDDVPRARDLAIEPFRPALADMALIDVRARPFMARYLVVGPDLQRIFGRDPTGQLLAMLYHADVYAELRETISGLVARREPVFYSRTRSVLGLTSGYHRLILPLADGRGAIHRCLLALRRVAPFGAGAAPAADDALVALWRERLAA